MESSSIETDSWIAEIVLYHQAATYCWTNWAAPDRGCAVLLMVYFGIQYQMTLTGPQIASSASTVFNGVGASLNAVSEFLNGNGAINPPPYLFCDDGFAVYAPWDQPAKDTDGDIMVADVDDNGEPSEYWTVQEVFPTANDGENRAFWVSVFNGYIFDDADANNPDSTVLCSATRYAATTGPLTETADPQFERAVFNKFTWLCPQTFNPTGAHSYPLLSTLTTYEGYPTSGQQISIDRLAPVCSTLYHELFHLFSGAIDITYRLDSIIADAQEFEDSTYQNAETYVFFAVAAYIYLNAPTDTPSGSSDKPAIVFSGGIPQTVAQIFNQGY